MAQRMMDLMSSGACGTAESEPFVRRIRVLRRHETKGSKRAGGRLLAFLDADDEWRPGFLDTVLSLREKYPTAGAYAVAYEVQEPDGRVYVPRYTHMPAPPWEGLVPDYFQSALGMPIISSSSVAIHRHVFDRIGLFCPVRATGEDQDLWARIALKYPIAFTWLVGAVYHREVENRLCLTLSAHTFASSPFEKVLGDMQACEPVSPYAREFLASRKLIAAARYVLAGQPGVAREILKNCRTDLFYGRRLWWALWALMPSRITALAWNCNRKMKQMFRDLPG